MSEHSPPFLIWLLGLAPGVVVQTADQVQIEHEMGDNSTLWRRDQGVPCLPSLASLSFYRDFDGADLFSSSFKICSLRETKSIGSVPIVEPVCKLIDDLEEAGIQFPEPSIPFMSGTQWSYALTLGSGQVLEYDLELGEISGSYGSLEEVIEEWFREISA